MKNKFFVILAVLLIILCISMYLIYNYRRNAFETQKNNEIYKEYYGKQILGTDLISIINKTIDFNEKNRIKKDSQGLYIEDNEKSIKVYIDFLYKDDYETIEMEKIASKGIENFRETYSSANFKCTEIGYHEKTKNVKFLKFTETEE